MGHLIHLVAVALVASICAADANAGPISPSALDPDDTAWFYNRVGANPDQVNADVAECASFGTVLSGEGSATQGVMQRIMLEIVTAGPIVAYTDDCMVSKGYRRFNVAGRSQRAFTARLSSLAGSEQARFAGAETPPEGVLAREWANTYWIPTAGEELPDTALQRPHQLVAADFRHRPAKLFIEALTNGSVASPGPDDVVFVMTLRSRGRENGKIYFARDHEASGTPDPVLIGRRQRWPTLIAEIGDRQPDQTGTVRLVFVAPAGTYALSAVGQGYYIRSTFFCYGTPAFTARPGDVVHLGAYTVETEPSTEHALAPTPRQRLRVDMPTLAAAMADLQEAPELAARMTTAHYVNNFPHACPETVGIAAYGVDIPGVPSRRNEPTVN